MPIQNKIWKKSPSPLYPGRHELNLKDLSVLIPLIDWHYFYLAWHVQASTEAANQLRQDAEIELEKLLSLKILRASSVVAFFPVLRNGDSLQVYSSSETISEKPIAHFHFLRMQEILRKDAYCSIADYFNPNELDYIGTFALSASLGLEKALAQTDDPYRSLLWKTLAARLTEAYAEYMHKEVMQKWWGYALDKSFGIRPVPGYPTTPDHSELETLWKLLVPESIEMHLTESRMMIPEASICGYYVAHPSSHYFNIRHIGNDQLADYALRKGWSLEQAKQELKNLI